MTFLAKKLTNRSKLCLKPVSKSGSTLPLDSFTTFGDLLKYLRRRARLTQRELAVAVGYSEAQISRLEQNQRPPDLATLTALFIPALYVDDEPEIVARLMELASRARGEATLESRIITFSHSVRREKVRTVEENLLHNLPLQLTSFVGREREIAEILNRFDGEKEKARLVTLTGSGGCGKTRLALEATQRMVESYSDGIWLVELASISDPNLVLQAVTSTLGILESRDASPTISLTKHLRPKQLLLIMDNCEQVVTGVAGLAEEILQTCPRVNILATSREILDISGEVQFRVSPLSLEEREASRSEAVSLFIDRAQTVLPSFEITEEILPDITRICRLVDGMPLGIELAAAKIAVLSVGQIVARLSERFQIPSGNRTALPHHQTLEATIAWSYDLLSEEERVVLQRLSVFSGGWTLEAAEAVTSNSSSIPVEKVLDLLSQLINKSLVVVEWQAIGEARYSMLQIILEFARRKLRAANEAERVQARHFDYFLTMAQQARLFGKEKGMWLDRLEAEHDNLRSALALALQAKTPEKGAELILPILDFYWYRGYVREARELLDKFIEAKSPASSQRALLLQKAGWLTRASGDFGKAGELLKHSLEMALEIGDKNRGAWALMDMGLSARDQGDHKQAISCFLQGLTFAQESGENRAIGVCLYSLAQSYDLTGSLDKSRKYWEQGLDILRAEGDPTHIAWGLEGIAGNAYLANDFANARRFHLESLKFKVDVMDKLGIAYSFEGLAQVSAAEEEVERAAVLWGAAHQLREVMNIPLESSRQDIYTSLIPITRAKIGDEVFEDAWKMGKAMSLNEAIEYALNFDEG